MVFELLVLGTGFDFSCLVFSIKCFGVCCLRRCVYCACKFGFFSISLAFTLVAI